MLRTTVTPFVLVVVTLALIASPVAAVGTAQTTAGGCLDGCLQDPSKGEQGPPEFIPQPERDVITGFGSFIETSPEDATGLGQTEAFLKAKKAFLKAKKAFVTNPDNMVPEWIVPGGGVAYDGKIPVSVMPGDNVQIGGVIVTNPDNMAPGCGDKPFNPSLK